MPAISHQHTHPVIKPTPPAAPRPLNVYVWRIWN
jgi:hypothetical protein